MPDEFNPYAAPTSTAMHPRAAEWLRSTDDPSLAIIVIGLVSFFMYLGLLDRLRKAIQSGGEQYF